MCGLFASINFNLDEKSINHILDSINFRGPDARQYLKYKNNYFAHVRLSILDLDERSNQPFLSDCGRYLVIYNGEVYNFKELKSDLKKLGYVFNTTSDTEVILKLYQAFSFKMLNKIEGMFSFIIYDKKLDESFIARDHFGIKPLYYSIYGEALFLCSQIKGLLNLKFIDKSTSLEAKDLFHFLGYIPEPLTWFENIKSFPAGHYAIYKKKDGLSLYQYYNLKANFEIQNEYSSCDKEDLFSKVADEIIASLKKHLVSDVEVGLFLSAGIDSSTLLSILSERNINIKTTTISFENNNFNFNEGSAAKKIASYFKSDHTEKTVTMNDFRENTKNIFSAMDQPSIDGINTWFAAREIKKKDIKVVLSGVGADELLNGYSYYRYLRSNIFRNITKFSNYSFMNYLLKIFSSLISLKSQKHKWKILNKVINNPYSFWLLIRVIDTKRNIDNFDYYKDKLQAFISNIDANQLNTFSYLDNSLYLQNQLLRDSDWASMYHSLELRTPYIDKSLILNLSKIKTSLNKYSKKEILLQNKKIHLPKKILDRPKTGFMIPLNKWLDAQDIFKKNENKKLSLSHKVEYLYNQYV